MIVQYVKFESALTETEVVATAKERLPQFQALPGLLQKYYVKLNEPDRYGGIYIWDSRESMLAYKESDLAATIPSAYKIKGTLKICVLQALFQLRD